MKLIDLLYKIGIETQSVEDISIHSINKDSRHIHKGDLFFDTSLNPDFVKSAFDKGAIGIITNNPALLRQPHVYFHPNPRLAYAHACSALFPHTVSTTVAVTGTNGKSSTVDFIRQLFEGLEIHAVSLGTVGVIGKNTKNISLPSLTTPDAKDLHKLLCTLSKKGVEAFSFEASSHGLDQYRLHGLSVNYACFTNLSQDHLDYHLDMESYFQAKVKLFTEVLSPLGTAVINLDCPYGERLVDICKKSKRKIITYSTTQTSADIFARVTTYYGRGMQLYITYGEEMIDVDVSIVGSFQLENILCALGVLLSQKRHTLTDLKSFISKLTPPPGRMEYVGSTSSGADIFVDYAHTPDALKRALDALQQHTKNRVYVVFGCGGDRDKEKRPIMGQIAKKHAHFSIITDDNPRSEDPADIRAQIRTNHPLALDVCGREHAIEKGISLLKSGDSLLIAGKGHEDTQTFKDKTISFSDRLVVLECLKKKAS